MMNFDDLKKQGQNHLNEHKDEYIEKGKDYLNGSNAGNDSMEAGAGHDDTSNDEK